MMPNYLGKLFSFFDARTRWQIGGIFVLMLGGAALEMLSIALLVPLLQLAVDPERIKTIEAAEWFLESWASGSPQKGLFIFAFGLFVLFVLKNTALAGIAWLQAHFVNIKHYQFADHLLSTYIRRDYAAHIRQNSAEIIRNVTISARELFGKGLLSILTIVMEGLLIAAAVTVLVVVEPWATFLAIVVVGGSMGLFYWLMRLRVASWGLRLETLKTSMIQAVTEGLDSFKEIKLLDREEEAVAQFSRPNRTSADLLTWLVVAAQVPRYIGEVVILGCVMLVVVYVVLGEGRSLADAVPVLGLFAAAAVRILPSVNRVIAAAIQMRRNKAIVENLYRDMQVLHPAQRPSGGEAAVSFADHIRLEGVSFGYGQAATTSIRGVDLVIRRGETVAFVGPSGAGKTTLADLILGLLEPTEGRILVDGLDVRFHLRSWQDHVGYVPQNVSLSDRTFAQNIAFMLPDEAIDKDRVRRAGTMAQLDDVIAERPGGLDAVVGERGTWLSGGQRQRVGIARALYHDPDILVLDEATSALDTETENAVSSAISKLAGRKTLIIIAHRMSTIRTCNRIFFLDKGVLKASGSFADLYEGNEEFRNYLDVEVTREEASSVEESGGTDSETIT